MLPETLEGKKKPSETEGCTLGSRGAAEMIINPLLASRTRLKGYVSEIVQVESLPRKRNQEEKS